MNNYVQKKNPITDILMSLMSLMSLSLSFIFRRCIQATYSFIELYA